MKIILIDVSEGTGSIRDNRREAAGEGAAYLNSKHGHGKSCPD